MVASVVLTSGLLWPTRAPPAAGPIPLPSHPQGCNLARVGSATGTASAPGAIAEPRARDHAAREFKRFLKLEQAWKPASVNLALAAADHFNRFVALGPAIVTREPLAQTAPRALSMQRSLSTWSGPAPSRARLPTAPNQRHDQAPRPA